jgi:hypothetical protein
MGHARHRVRQVFSTALVVAAGNHARERDLAVAHGHLDIGGVESGIVREMVVHILPDAFIGPLVTARAPTPVLSAYLIPFATGALDGGQNLRQGRI